jgi:hypothetical protein
MFLSLEFQSELHCNQVDGTAGCDRYENTYGQHMDYGRRGDIKVQQLWSTMIR